jgi:hypothetical protein
VRRYEPCQTWCDQFGCYYGTKLGETQRGAPIIRWEIDRYVHCTWEFQQKLQPTDRRAGQKFGATVFMEEETGTIVVGAQFSYSIDIFNQKSSLTSSWSSYRDLETSGGKDDNRPGAVYIFSRVPESRTGLGNLLKEPTWPVTERFKLQPIDAIERMGYGSAKGKLLNQFFFYVFFFSPHFLLFQIIVFEGISLNNYHLIVAAPRDVNGGSIHSYNIEYQRLYILHRQFAVDEGSNEGAPFVEVNVRH